MRVFFWYPPFSLIINLISMRTRNLTQKRKSQQSFQRVNKRDIEKQKSKLAPLTSQQLNIVRGLILSGKGQLREQSSKKGRSFSFYIEENLANLDFIYQVFKNFDSFSKQAPSWVNLRPKKTLSSKGSKLAFNTFSSSDFSLINEEFQGEVKVKGRVFKRGKLFPSPNFQAKFKLDSESLSFWQFCVGCYRQGYFFMDLSLQSPVRVQFFVNFLNKNFPFKVITLKDQIDLNGSSFLFKSLLQAKNSKENRFIDTKNSFEYSFLNQWFFLSTSNFNLKAKKILVIQENQDSFFSLIKKNYLLYSQQKLLFPVQGFQDFYDFNQPPNLSKEDYNKALFRKNLNLYSYYHLFHFLLSIYQLNH